MAAIQGGVQVNIVERIARGKLLCSDGVIRSVREIAKIVGISRAGINSRISLHGLTSDLVWKTVDRSLVFGVGAPEEIVERRKEGACIIFKGDDGLWYRLGDLAEATGISRKLLGHRLKDAKLPVKTDVVCSSRKRKPGPSLPRLGEAGIVNGFNRTAFCHRETGECIRYTKCLDAMCWNPKWEWCGMECYKAPAKKEATYRAIRADI